MKTDGERGRRGDAEMGEIGRKDFNTSTNHPITDSPLVRFSYFGLNFFSFSAAWWRVSIFFGKAKRTFVVPKCGRL
jgi:hypothetical protein